MASESQQIAPDGHQRGRQGCAILAAACALVIMACVLGSVAMWWRGGDLPRLNGHVGPYWIVAYTTVAPSCSPVVLCTQQFADVPLPRYYVIWLIAEHATNQTGTRVLTIPMTLPRAR